MLVTGFVVFFGLLTSLTTNSATRARIAFEDSSQSTPKLWYNLTVRTTFGIHPQKIIVVNLTWSKSLANSGVVSYHVVVMPVGRNDSKKCERDFIGYQEDIYNVSSTSITLEFDNPSSHINTFHFGCSYNVSVEYYPTGLKANGTINIPDCIDETCLCTDKIKLPPVNNITIKSVNDSPWIVELAWTHDVNSSVKFFRLQSFRKGNPAERYFVKYKWIKVNKTTSENYSKVITLHNSTSLQKVAVVAFDEHLCNTSAIITIECTTKGFCNCFDESIPVPSGVTANYNISSSFTKVHWKYPYYHDLNYFHIVTNTGKHNSTINDVYIGTNTTDLHPFDILLPCDPTIIMTFSIRAVNRDGCYGSESKEIFFNCRIDELLTRYNSMNGVIIGCLFIFALALFASAVFVKRKQLRKFINTKFKSPKERFISSAIIEYSRNLIYIEKEIQDAREQGLVDQFEINYCRLEFGKEIGKGAFGRVFIATVEAIGLTSGQSTVAVKQLREGASDLEIEDFKAEIAMMKQVGKHPHVVTMIACCTMQQPFCMVMEYIPCGDLQRYLKKLRKEYVRRVELDFSGSTTPNGCNPYILAYGFRSNQSHNDSSEYLLPRSQTSSNMTNGTINTSTYTIPEEDENLSSPEEAETLIEQSSVKTKPPSDGYVVRNYVRLGSILPPSSDSEKSTYTSESNYLDSEELHMFALQIARGMCHLASKGITHRDLAARNVLIDENKTLKISDFGLSRTGIYVTQRGGRVPLRWLSIEAIRDNLYSMESDVWAFGVVLWEICTLGGFPYPKVSDTALLNYLLNGHRLEKPDNCADELYSIMEACWNEDPRFRPSFHDLRDLLEKMKDESHVYVNFDVITNRPLPPDESEVKKMKVNDTST